MTSKQVSEMNSSLVNEIYKMLRKYLALRNIVKNLRVSSFKQPSKKRQNLTAYVIFTISSRFVT
jgi:hypothetical protein